MLLIVNSILINFVLKLFW